MRNLCINELQQVSGGDGDGSLENPYTLPPVIVTPPQHQASSVITISDPTQIGIFLDSLPEACSGTTMVSAAAGGAFAGGITGAIAGAPGLLPGVLIMGGAGIIGGGALGAASAAIGCAIAIKLK